MKLNFHHGIVSYLTKNSWLDHWTAVHMAAGAFICKVAQCVELQIYGRYYGLLL